MPQSSLSAWLNKASSATVQDNLPAHLAQKDEETIPKPPASLQYDPNASKHPVETNFNTNGTIPLSQQQNPRLPPNISFRACTQADIPSLKNLTTTLLPIPYPDSFYRETVSSPTINSLTLLAFWHDDPPNNPATTTPDSTTSAENATKAKLIGAIRTRLLPLPLPFPPNTTPSPHHPPVTASGPPMLYLSTLLLLSPYRGQGIASTMLAAVTERAVREHGVGSVGAHVWEANVEAREWYGKRGFREVGVEEGYYRRLRPEGAVVVKRTVGVAEMVGDGFSEG